MINSLSPVQDQKTDKLHDWLTKKDAGFWKAQDKTGFVTPKQEKKATQSEGRWFGNIQAPIRVACSRQFGLDNSLFSDLMAPFFSFFELTQDMISDIFSSAMGDSSGFNIETILVGIPVLLLPLLSLSYLQTGLTSGLASGFLKKNDYDNYLRAFEEEGSFLWEMADFIVTAVETFNNLYNP